MYLLRILLFITYNSLKKLIMFYLIFYLKILTIDESKNSINLQPKLPFLKPKTTGSAFCPVISKPLMTDSNTFSKACIQETRYTLNECKQTLSASISTQMLIESSKEQSQPPIPKCIDLETVSVEVPHEIRSLLPLNNNIRGISPTHLVVFPPEIPPEYRIHSRSKTSTPQPKHENNAKTKPEATVFIDVNQAECDAEYAQYDAEVPHENHSLSPTNSYNKGISPTNLIDFPLEIPQDNEVHIKSKTSTPQQKFEFDVEIKPKCETSIDVNQVESTISQYTVECMEVVEPNYNKQFNEYDGSKHKLSSNVQNEQNTQISLIKSKSPTSVSEERNIESPMVAALKTAPERSYSPLPTFVDAREFIPKPTKSSVEKEKPMTMADALAIAPDRSYKLPESNTSTRPVGNNPVRYMHGYNKKTPVVPLLITRSLIYSPVSSVDLEEEQIANLGLKSFPPVSDELKWSTAAGDFDRSESLFECVEEIIYNEPKIEEPEVPNNEETIIEQTSKLLPRHPFTASGLHEPLDIPRYQQSIPENPHGQATSSDKSSKKLIGPGIKNKVSAFSPKESIKNASFLKQEPNVHSKVAPVLGYEPSSLDGTPSKTKMSLNSNAIKLNDNDPILFSNTSITTPLKSTPIPQSFKESVPLTLKPSISNDTFVESVAPMPKSSVPAILLSKKLTCLTKKQQPKCIPTPIPTPDIGGQLSGRTGASAGLTVPRRGRGVLNPQNLTPGARVPLCGQCNLYIR